MANFVIETDEPIDVLGSISHTEFTPSLNSKCLTNGTVNGLNEECSSKDVIHANEEHRSQDQDIDKTAVENKAPVEESVPDLRTDDSSKLWNGSMTKESSAVEEKNLATIQIQVNIKSIKRERDGENGKKEFKISFQEVRMKSTWVPKDLVKDLDLFKEYLNKKEFFQRNGESINDTEDSSDDDAGLVSIPSSPHKQQRSKYLRRRRVAKIINSPKNVNSRKRSRASSSYRNRKESIPRQYKVEKIVGKRIDKNGDTTFEIKWEGYSPNSNTWEPYESVKHLRLLKQFENHWSNSDEKPSRKSTRVTPKKVGPLKLPKATSTTPKKRAKIDEERNKETADDKKKQKNVIESETDDHEGSDDDQEYEVDIVLDKRYVNSHGQRSLEYLIKWKGFDDNFNTWEPYSSMKHLQAVKDYEIRSAGGKKNEKAGSTPKRRSPRR